MEALRKKWQDKGVAFLVVYTREPHPGIGGYGQTRDYEQKRQYARACQQKYQIGRRVVIDTFDSKFQRAYGGLPNNAYVIDRDGRVAYKEAWSNPRTLDRVLALLSRSSVEFY